MNYVLLICKWLNEKEVSPSWWDDIGINNSILQLTGTYYWLLIVGEGLFNLYILCHVNYVNLGHNWGWLRGGRGPRSLFAKKKLTIHFSRNMKWPFHETKIKGVRLPVGIKRPGAQNDDKLITVIFLYVILFWYAYCIIFLKEEKQ